MRKLALALALLAPSVYAEPLLAKRGDDWIRISPAACEVESVLKVIPITIRPQFFQGAAYVGGQSYSICWADAGVHVYIVYDDGDQAMVEWSEFKEDTGTI